MEFIEVKIPKKYTNSKFQLLIVFSILVGFVAVLVVLELLRNYFIYTNRVTLQSYFFDIFAVAVFIGGILYFLFQTIKKQSSLLNEQENNNEERA